MAPTSKPISNLIQGVSQQSAQQRRDSQCESQFDCINSPKDGAVARGGGELVQYYPGADLTDTFPYELLRGREEHYLILLGTQSTTALRAYDLRTGVPCTVTDPSGTAAAYMDTGGYPAPDCFCCQTVDDYTFIANKTVAPQMGPDLSTSRPREALVFFKAGAYSSTYSISILWAGVTYRWLYQTPDNSVSSNAAYIATNYLAAVFYRAMSGSVPAGSGNGNTGSVFDGSTGGKGAASADNSAGGSTNPTLGALGFSIAINGNLLRIWRNDGANFTMDTNDAAGDTYLVAFKDTVRSFTELPKGGFEGFLLKVKSKPAQGDTAADFYVEYVNANATTGYWQERCAPGIHTVLNPATMPHTLINTAPGVFEFRPQVWSSRIAGDGVDTAKDPGFVGKRIEDLFYHKGRLGLLTEGTCDFSKARNVFTYFPDTVQTVLSDAPIGLKLSASDTIALLRRVAKVDESLFLWAQGAQFRLTSNNDPFKQDTVEANDSTAYEFAEHSNFARVGATLYFATEPNGFATLRNLTFNQGRAVGDVDVTAHVAEYVAAGVRRLSPSDTGQMLFVRTDGDPSSLYLYNYLVQDRTVVQSAWNKWRLPVNKVIWASVFRLNLLVLAQRDDGAVLLKFPLSARELDPDPGADYLTRLDLRVNEGSCLVTYDEVNDTSTITAPYQVPPADAGAWSVVSRSPGSHPRGREAKQVGQANWGLKVQGDWRGSPFYFGRRITSERTESTFYLRTEDGVVPTDSLNLREFNVRYASTGYTRIEVNVGAGRPLKVHETKHIPLGSSTNAMGYPPIIKAGLLRSVVDAPNEEATLRIVNDTWLPSRWQTADYRYEAVVRAKVGAAGKG